MDSDSSDGGGSITVTGNKSKFAIPQAQTFGRFGSGLGAGILQSISDPTDDPTDPIVVVGKPGPKVKFGPVAVVVASTVVAGVAQLASEITDDKPGINLGNIVIATASGACAATAGLLGAAGFVIGGAACASQGVAAINVNNRIKSNRMVVGSM